MPLTACSRCGGRLLRPGARCPHCGTLAGELAVEPVEPAAGFTTSGEVDLGGTRPRRRGIAVAVAAVAALGVGAYAVSRGGSQRAVPPPATSTTSTTPPTSASAATLDATTTTLPDDRWALADRPSDALPEPTGGTVLYLLDDVGPTVVRVDLDARTVQARPVSLGGAPGEPQSLLPRAGGVFVLPMFSNDVGTFLPEGDGPPRRVAQDTGVLFAANESSLLWRVAWPYFSGAVTKAALVDLDGKDVLPPHDVPGASFVMGDDGNGLLLLGSTAGAYRLDPFTGVVSRVDRETPLAWTAQRLLTAVCDDELACRFRLVDRLTGGEQLGAPVPDDLRLNAQSAGIGLLDPSGTRLARFDGMSIVVSDVVTGSEQLFLATSIVGGGDYGSFPFAWSRSGRWLFWPAGQDEPDRIVAWHDGLADPTVLRLRIPGAQRIVALAVASPPVPG